MMGKKVAFTFEGRAPNYLTRFNMPRKEWANLSDAKSRSGELEIVEKRILPDLLAYMKLMNRQTLLDLGHHTLYFMDALVEVLLKHSYSFIIVRITRPLLENALSLMYKSPGEPRETICDMTFSYCPSERTKTNIIPVVSQATWDSMTVFQQSLWLTEEVEQRWRRLVHNYPSIERLHVDWSSHNKSSFAHGATRIAKLMNCSQVHMHPPKTVHAGNLTSQLYNEEDLPRRLQEEERFYRQKIGKYTSYPAVKDNVIEVMQDVNNW